MEELTGSRDALGVGDREGALDEIQVAVDGNEVFPDPFDEPASRLDHDPFINKGSKDRTLRVGQDHLDIGSDVFEVASKPREGAAGTHAADHRVE